MNTELDEQQQESHRRAMAALYRAAMAAKRYRLAVWFSGFGLFLFLTYSASQGNGWRGMGMAMFVVPVVNLIFLGVALFAAKLLQVSHPEIPSSDLTFTAVVAPIVCAFVTFFAILALPLHGC